MQEQHGLIRIKKSVFIFIIFVFILVFATPVLADYLGPNRTATETTSACKVVLSECMLVAAKGDYRYHQVDNWSCSNESKPWLGYENYSGDCESWNTGHTQWDKVEQVQTITITHPEATIISALQDCTLQNGWCITSPQLTLTANEPLPGYQILIIEGMLNSDAFACNGSNCSVLLNEGLNNFTYWALSSWGDSSQMGTTSVKVDTVSPDINLVINGSNGTGGWYTSTTILTASAVDATSGLAMLEANTDNITWMAVSAPLTFTDGIHTPAFRATDNAENVSSTAVTISVDTITPSLALTTNGAQGINNWYRSNTKIAAAASDATSGVASIQASADGGAWMVVNELTFADGIHTYKFKATDNAGNVTETSEQTTMVDTIPPAIALTEESNLGESFVYSLQDDGSGLYTVRIVIEDDDERFPKVVWKEDISGRKFKDEFVWDGKFADGRSAPLGEYIITIKARDAAGNETISSGIVKINPLSYFQPIPAFNPPAESPLSVGEDQGEGDIQPTFGGNTTSVTGVTIQTLNLNGNASGAAATSSNVLWGVIAAALIGAATASALEEQKKRKEAEAAQAAQVIAEVEAFNAAQEANRIAMAEQLKIQNWLQGQAAFNELINKAQEEGVDNKEIEQLKETAATQGFGAAIGEAVNTLQTQIAQNAASQQALEDFRQGEWDGDQDIVEAWNAQQSANALAEQQAGLAAYYEGRKAGEEASNSSVKPEAQLEKAWNWAFNNQFELSLGTGIVVGLAAVVIGIITAPTWLLIGGAVMFTAVLVTAGTVVLNSHFGQDLGNNLVTNLIVGTAATFVTAGLGLLLTSFAPVIGTTIVNKCTEYATACSQIGTIIDSGEEALLSAQIAYYNWAGNQDKAAQTTIELQLELMDGGAPGNSVAIEMGEQIAKLGPEAAEQIAKHGSGIIPLLLKHGDNAIGIIGTYGDDGVTLLMKFGDDAGEAISLVKEFGTPAEKLLNIVDPTSVNNLLTTLDDDVLDYAIKQGPDAVSALSRWSDDELMEYGSELALRAEKDAKALNAVNSLVSLGPIDPKHLTTEQKDLIKIIAENSTQYNDEGQVVLGKWVDYGNGFTSYARETGSVHYNPHPDLWKLLGELGKENRADAAWLVNKQVIQTGIDKGLPFEYTLNDLPLDKLELEEYAIEKIWEGGSSRETIYTNLKESLGVSILPIRLQELVELYSAGYIYSFDSITNSYILIKP